MLPALATKQPKGEEGEGEEGDEFSPHPMWLTRERTDNEGLSLPSLRPGRAGLIGRRRPKEVPQRRAYLQLDILNPGDVFVSDNTVLCTSICELWGVIY